MHFEYKIISWFESQASNIKKQNFIRNLTTHNKRNFSQRDYKSNCNWLLKQGQYTEFSVSSMISTEKGKPQSNDPEEWHEAQSIEHEKFQPHTHSQNQWNT